MRLYSENQSPFSAPVRIAIYAKALDVEIVAPPGGLRSAEYHRINPLGTIPCLMLDDGTRLPESSAIMEYLEEKFPDPPLLPVSPEARAQVRLLQRIGELHITTQTVELAQLPGAAGDEATANRLTRIVRGLSALQNILAGDAFAVGPHLTLADCQLAPALFRVPRVVGAFMNRDLIGAYPKVARYVETSRRHKAVARVLEEMGAALA
ncbi:MAG: glutathione S-transferase family protein [Xanthobacteraceae bacterium]